MPQPLTFYGFLYHRGRNKAGKESKEGKTGMAVITPERATILAESCRKPIYYDDFGIYTHFSSQQELKAAYNILLPSYLSPLR